jgi:hypothetical protein
LHPKMLWLSFSKLRPYKIRGRSAVLRKVYRSTPRVVRRADQKPELTGGQNLSGIMA